MLLPVGASVPGPEQNQMRILGHSCEPAVDCSLDTRFVPIGKQIWVRQSVAVFFKTAGQPPSCLCCDRQ
jgi:hypothetical protein